LLLSDAISDLEAERVRKLSVKPRISLHGTKLSMSSMSAESTEEVITQTSIGGSYVIWNKDSSSQEKKLDPNYLAKSQFEHSSFHHCLHKFV
jgi:hypothetical protein